MKKKKKKKKKELVARGETRSGIVHWPTVLPALSRPTIRTK
jgi:hypothetical protein